MFAPYSVGFKNRPHLVAHLSKCPQLLFGRTLGLRRIIERPMVSIQMSWENRTCLVSVATHGNHCFHLLVQELCNRFGAMLRNVDSYLRHHLYCKGMHKTAWLASRAGNLKKIPGSRLQEPLRHLTAARVRCAKDQDQRQWRVVLRFSMRLVRFEFHMASIGLPD